MRFAGYTLVELLIAISIITILGVIAFVNYRSFSQDQILNKGAGQIQTILRLAQADATSGTFCKDSGGVGWSVKFNKDNPGRVDLTCSDAQTIKQSYYLENVRINTITSSSCIGPTYPAATVFISYAALSGKMNFSGDDCINGTKTVTSPSLTISIQNTVSANLKNLILTKGGSINVQ